MDIGLKAERGSHTGGWEGTLEEQWKISVDLDPVSITGLELGGGHADTE